MNIYGHILHIIVYVYVYIYILYIYIYFYIKNFLPDTVKETLPKLKSELKIDK